MRGEGDPSPLTLACVTLEQALSRRATLGDGPPAPRVVAIGDVDVFDTDNDPHAAARGDAAIHLTASAVLVGPWPRAGDAPCGACLARRWQRLRGRYEREALETGTATGAAGTWPTLTDYAVEAAWSVYAATARPGTAGPARVSRIDLETLAVQTEPILAEPRCPVCGPPAVEGPEPTRPRLESRAKRDSGTYRQRPAESYPLPTAALANRFCGAIGAGTTMNVVSPTTAPVSGRIAMRGHGGLTDISWSGQANSYRLSRSLAFLEGLERYAGTHPRRAERFVVGSYERLADDALDPRDCGVYDERTYRDDPTLTPFTTDLDLPWTWGYSLRDDRPILVPARLSYYSSGTHADRFVLECSNGCASGASLEEAVLFGLLELIERDAFLLGWYGGARLTRVDLGSVHDAEIHAMIDRAALCGYEVRVFDNRIDLPVPVATGVAVRRDGGPGALCFAAASSLDPAEAINGALSEILTYMPSLPGQVRAREGELRAMAADFAKVAELPDHAALFGLPEMTPHAHRYLDDTAPVAFDEVYASWQRPETHDLLEDLRICQRLLTDAGFDVIVVDQTCPEQELVGLRSVSVIVPGLVPIDFGWRRQRALTMPRTRTAFRRAGWRATDLDEAELHRVPHPFP